MKQPSKAAIEFAKAQYGYKDFDFDKIDRLSIQTKIQMCANDFDEAVKLLREIAEEGVRMIRTWHRNERTEKMQATLRDWERE